MTRRLQRALIAGALLVVAVFLFPSPHITSGFDVEVTWSISETNMVDHTVSIDGRDFIVPAGEQVVQMHELRGGRKEYYLYSYIGWGFLGKNITVDGVNIPLTILRTSSYKGQHRVLWMKTDPSMHAQIDLDEAKEVNEDLAAP